MNNPHQNTRLSVYSREQIVARVMAGQRAAEVAADFAVSVRTVRKWVARFKAGVWRSQIAQARPPAWRTVCRIASWRSSLAALSPPSDGGGDRVKARAGTLRLLGIRHIFTRPYTPRDHG